MYPTMWFALEIWNCRMTMCTSSMPVESALCRAWPLWHNGMDSRPPRGKRHLWPMSEEEAGSVALMTIH